LFDTAVAVVVVGSTTLPLSILFDVDDDGVVVDEEVLFEFDDDDELPFEDVARKRLKMNRIALESPSPIVER
jgi:hypothetical protein